MNLDAISQKKTPAKVNSLAHSLQFDPWLVVVLACFVIFAWISWGKLNSPIIDYGREVEIPARLLAGDVLYRDVNTYYGPLAYYVNALALLIFGHHLAVFYGVSLSLALAATLLVYHLGKQLTDAPWSALCTLCVLIYCFFSLGLYSFTTPYSYGGVYATVLCLLAFTALDRYGNNGKIGWLMTAAIACGLAGIAKQEYGVAALGGLLIGINVQFSQKLGTRLKHSVLLIVVAGICGLLPLAAIAQQIGWEQLHSSLIPSAAKLSVLKSNSFFQVSPTETLIKWKLSFSCFAVASLIIWFWMVVVRWLSKHKWFTKLKGFRVPLELLLTFTFSWIGLALVNLVLVRNFAAPTVSGAIFHPLNNMHWAIPILVGWFALRWSKLLRVRQAPLLWSLLIFSLLLNARWFFHIGFYGLYATSVILLFFTLLYYLALQTGKSSLIWRYLLICLLIGGVMNLVGFGQYRYPVHSPYGTFYTPHTDLALALNQTIDSVNASKATSVLVLPEGLILNFLTATHSPSPETTFLPNALPTSDAERDFVEQMRANSPELIVYVKRNFEEWGYQTYAEFNPIVDRWITRQHKLVNVFPNDEDAIIRIYTDQKWLPIKPIATSPAGQLFGLGDPEYQGTNSLFTVDVSTGAMSFVREFGVDQITFARP